ncbi:MAG: hypothetical protein EA394_07835 [Bacteroidia bacterium]|nr:MAG: hypothetical protein EA394_07835 [Bacteroidia bacterium]
MDKHLIFKIVLTLISKKKCEFSLYDKRLAFYPYRVKSFCEKCRIDNFPFMKKKRPILNHLKKKPRMITYPEPWHGIF